MPVLSAAAVYAAAVKALPAVLPAGVAMVAFGIIASHTREPELQALKGAPETAAECIQRNVQAGKNGLSAVVQPLFGTSTYSVVLKRGGVTGEPVMTVLLQSATTGSHAEFRSLGLSDTNEQIAQLIAGC